jgi:hypothetical protein
MQLADLSLKFYHALLRGSHFHAQLPSGFLTRQ